MLFISDVISLLLICFNNIQDSVCKILLRSIIGKYHGDMYSKVFSDLYQVNKKHRLSLPQYSWTHSYTGLYTGSIFCQSHFFGGHMDVNSYIHTPVEMCFIT